MLANDGGELPTYEPARQTVVASISSEDIFEVLWLLQRMEGRNVTCHLQANHATGQYEAVRKCWFKQLIPSGVRDTGAKKVPLLSHHHSSRVLRARAFANDEIWWG